MVILEAPDTEVKLSKEACYGLRGGEDPFTPSQIGNGGVEAPVLETTYGRFPPGILEILDSHQNADWDDGYDVITELYNAYNAKPRQPVTASSKEIAEKLIRREIRAKAKKKAIKRRRQEFAHANARLTLLLLDSGVEYVCNWPGCEQCEGLTIDHIMPVSRGGGDEPENLQFLCRSHNATKGDRPWSNYEE